jgi:hypothetical protein
MPVAAVFKMERMIGNAVWSADRRIAATSITQLILDVNGVRNPRHSAPAGIVRARNVRDVAKNGCCVPYTTRAAAAENLRMISATPAAPVGKMENSLCISTNLPALSSQGNIRSEYPALLPSQGNMHPPGFMLTS